VISPFAPNALIAVGGIRISWPVKPMRTTGLSSENSGRVIRIKVSRIIEELIEKNDLATKMILKNHWINKSAVVRVPGKARTLSHLAS